MHGLFPLPICTIPRTISLPSYHNFAWQLMNVVLFYKPVNFGQCFRALAIFNHHYSVTWRGSRPPSTMLPLKMSLQLNTPSPWRSAPSNWLLSPSMPIQIPFLSHQFYHAIRNASCTASRHWSLTMRPQLHSATSALLWSFPYFSHQILLRLPSTPYLWTLSSLVTELSSLHWTSHLPQVRAHLPNPSDPSPWDFLGDPPPNVVTTNPN